MKRTLEEPQILKQGAYGHDDVDRLKHGHVWQVVDAYSSQSESLFEIENPRLTSSPSYKDHLKTFLDERQSASADPVGDWIYFPWNGLLVHSVSEKEQMLLRTNRNRSLVTIEEQEKLMGVTVAIAGLSVGGGIALSLSQSGIANTMYLADHDLLEAPNLNRVQASLANIGTPKLSLVARKIWELNPYAQLKLFASGVDASNGDQFLGGSESVDIVFDEIDDFQMKVLLRQKAKSKRIPVVMLTALGDTVLIDIERYDLEPELAIFNGLIGDLENRILGSEVTSQDARRYAAQIVGIENVPTRAIQSLLEMGHTLVGRPQLSSTVTLEAGLGAFVARKLALGSPLKSGRYRMNLNQLSGLEDESMATSEREKALTKLLGNN